MAFTHTPDPHRAIHDSHPLPRHKRIPSTLLRGGFFATVWWVLTEGDIPSWIIGGPTVIAATATSLALSPTYRWQVRISGCLRFLGFFLLASWRGGVDVAWRAFHRQLPISPVLIDYSFRLPAGPTRVFLANTLSLLPGTLNAALYDDHITVHVLASTPETVVEEIRTLEIYIANVFGIVLASAERDGE